MTQILILTGLLFAELLAFYIVGLLIPFSRADGETSIAETVCSGFLVVSGVFEILAFVMTWLETSLVTFFYAFSIALGLIVALSAVFRIREWGRRVKWFFHHLHFKPLFLLAFCTVIILAWIALLKSGSDSTHSIAIMTTDLAHNSMGVYDPLTNARRTAFEPQVLLFRWPLMCAYLSFLLGLSPHLVARTTQTVLTVILSGFIYYRLGCRLFDRNTNKASLFLVMVSMTECFFATEFSAAGVLFTSAFSGDAVLANILIPAVFLLGASYADGEKEPPSIWLAFFLGAAGCGMTGAGAFFILTALAVVLIPCLLAGKRWKKIPGFILSLVLPWLAAVFCLMCAGIPVTRL